MEYDDKFIRNLLLLGIDNYNKIINSNITIVGLGAVGTHVFESIVRLGIKNIIIIDFDIIKTSNINRNLLALYNNINKHKIELAKERALQINPEINLKCYNIFLHNESLEILLDNRIDILVDAIDSFSPKKALLEFAIKNNITVISSMGAAMRTNPFLIRCGFLNETTVCPLAARLRRSLRKKIDISKIRCVYSIETPILNSNINYIEEKEFFERGRKRKPLGSLCYLTGIFGYIITYDVIKYLLNRKFDNNNLFTI